MNGAKIDAVRSLGGRDFHVNAEIVVEVCENTGQNNRKMRWYWMLLNFDDALLLVTDSGFQRLGVLPFYPQ